MPSGTPQPSFDRGRSLVAALRSPATVPRFRGPIPGSTFLACSFASNPEGSAARSALLLRCQVRLAPVLAASTLLARCCFASKFDRLLPRSPLPFGTFTSLQIKAFYRIRRPSTRLPTSPDSLSLPAAVSIAKSGFGSPFQSRYVSGGLLFLKPLGTFFTMPSISKFVNYFCD